MNSRERVSKYFKGEKVDRVPNFNIVMQFAAKHAGIPYGVFCLEHKALVEANIKTSIDFGIDTTNLMCDPYREVDDFGGKFAYFEDRMPVPQEIFISKASDLSKLKPFNPLERRRSLERIKAVALFKERVGNELSIYGHLDGPFAVTAMLRTVQNLLLDLYDSPEMVREMMDIALEVGLKTVEEQIKAGADVICMGEAAASLVSAPLYKEYIFPYDKKIVDKVHEMGKIARIHICGDTNHLLEVLAELGADEIDLDWMVDLKVALAKFKQKNIFISGNIDPVAIYLQGTPEVMEAKVKELVDLNDGRLIISSGCEIPPDSPEENVLAHHRALVKFSGR